MNPSTSPAHSNTLSRGTGWRIVLMRLRFAFFILGMAILYSSWPWIHKAWESMTAPIRNQSMFSNVAADTEYFCPMDPGITSVWPSICPICNMDLISRKKGDAQIIPSGVVSRMQLSPYRIQLAGVKTSPVAKDGDDASQAFRIPRTSLVQREHESIVYVERMPGMLDAIEVRCISSANDTCIVESKYLKPTDRVVSLGTLLVDAENRLNPNMSTQYFGANDQTALSASLAPKTKRKLRNREGESTLSPEDLALVMKQGVCPITDAPLDSMGGPIIIDLEGTRIAICCIGCETGLRESPSKYIEWLEKQLQRDSDSK